MRLSGRKEHGLRSHWELSRWRLRAGYQTKIRLINELFLGAMRNRRWADSHSDKEALFTIHTSAEDTLFHVKKKKKSDGKENVLKAQQLSVIALHISLLLSILCCSLWVVDTNDPLPPLVSETKLEAKLRSFNAGDFLLPHNVPIPKLHSSAASLQQFLF